jgi:CheY-like chemotaxis protein
MNTSNNTLPITYLFPRHILLADDDEDDCLLFKDALDELLVSGKFSCVTNGEKLMELLMDSELLPDIIFLDMNMPRKSGLQCLLEIKANESLKDLPVVILSTSFEPSMMKRLYENGAHLCLKKPNEFTKLKEAIHSALSLGELALTADKVAVVSQPSN